MNNITVYIKEWFFKKNIAESCWDGHYAEVIKETEKAYQVRVAINGDYWCKTWVPKSCTLTHEEYLEAVETAAAKANERWEAACKAYQELIAYAQQNGVRGVREGLRKETIINKIKAAGIPLPA